MGRPARTPPPLQEPCFPGGGGVPCFSRFGPPPATGPLAIRVGLSPPRLTKRQVRRFSGGTIMAIHSARIRNAGPILAVSIALVLASSCSKGRQPFTPPPKQDPQTELTYAPVEYDTTTFRVHLYWNGFVDDGEVVRFHYAVDADSLPPINEWKTTTAKDSTLLFLVDPVKELKLHVFKVSAEDNSGRWDKTPASRA